MNHQMIQRTQSTSQDLRWPDLVAKTARVTLKDTIRVILALEAISRFYECDRGRIVDAVRSFSATPPTSNNIAACERASKNLWNESSPARVDVDDLLAALRMFQKSNNPQPTEHQKSTPDISEVDAESDTPLGLTEVLRRTPIGDSIYTAIKDTAVSAYARNAHVKVKTARLMAIHGAERVVEDVTRVTVVHKFSK